EALPGRPITGERLVRHDGTISMGFYGDIYVRGLMPTQVKVKVLLHLRKFLNDEVLGLLVYQPDEETLKNLPGGQKTIDPPNGRNPFFDPKGEQRDPVPDEAPPTGKQQETNPRATEKQKDGKRSATLMNNRSRKRGRLPMKRAKSSSPRDV